MPRMPILRKPRKIKAVLFDLGNVILDFNFNPSFKRLSRHSSLSPSQIESFFWSSGLEVLYDGGKISSLSFYKEVKKSLKHMLSYDRFKSIWNDIFNPNQDIIALIRRLKKKYRLVLISNTNEMHYEYVVKKYTVLKLFDRIVLSFKVKSRKPDDKIFNVAIRACKAKPSEIFYIDDREELTNAAQELNLHVFTYKNNHKMLLKKMETLGMKF